VGGLRPEPDGQIAGIVARHIRGGVGRALLARAVAEAASGAWPRCSLVAPPINRVGNRLIILFGLLTAVSMWQMSQFSLQMGMTPVIISGPVAGFRSRLYPSAPQHHRVVDSAWPHPDPRDGDPATQRAAGISAINAPDRSPTPPSETEIRQCGRLLDPGGAGCKMSGASLRAQPTLVFRQIVAPV
jgi:hypothetical protein